MSAFAASLRLWRKSQLLNQKALAAQLGVTQSAVSRWENGTEAPSAAMVARLKDLIAAKDPIHIERQMIERQRTIRAFFDVENMSLLCFSAGLANVWPDFARIGDRSLRGAVTGELQRFVENDELVRLACSGDISFMSGVSERHLNLPLDSPFKHRWHIHFRRYGFRTIADMIFEECDPETRPGIEIMKPLDEYISHV